MENNISDSILKFYGEVKDLFTSNKASLSTLRKVGGNSFQDIVSSYDSLLTRSENEGPLVSKQKEPLKQANSLSQTWSNFIHGKQEESSRRNQAFNKLHMKKKMPEYNYSVFSLVQLITKPYMRITKDPQTKLRDNQDLHVSVTNVETMQRFFVKLTFDANCSNPIKSH